ncbi:MAG TPA: calcium/proton exchanger [Mycobacteriales bacterium]|nr:calcium/proton exchanger [Mycobacteriales bacterium]
MNQSVVSAGLSRGDRVLFGVCAVLTIGSAVVHYAALNETLSFIVSGLALALLAALVGRSVDQLGDRLGAGATGVIHAALGNLPELFVGIFALREGLVRVVEAAVIGSILSNLLLVLGLAFIVGGLRFGTQRFSGNRARTTISLMLLAVAGMLVPSLASYVHTPAAQHEQSLSIIAAVVLLAVFIVSIPASLSRTDEEIAAEDTSHEQLWPLPTAIVSLAVASLLSAFASDWFVDALTPAIHTLHISQTFAGLVIVALAGNAVENVVGIQLAAKGRADYALSVVLNSPLQIALVLAPVLVLLSLVIGGTSFLLVFPPLLVTTLVAAVIVVSFVIVDGESDWLEGSALVGLYVVIAASFWWG